MAETQLASYALFTLSWSLKAVQRTVLVILNGCDSLLFTISKCSPHFAGTLAGALLGLSKVENVFNF